MWSRLVLSRFRRTNRKAGSGLKIKNRTVAVLGAAGNMGSCIAWNLLESEYQTFLCEKGEGVNQLCKKGLENTEISKAVPKSDFVVMAVPDHKIGNISADVVPAMCENATMILLDHAAAYGEELTMREDCNFVVTHPCHPPLFEERETPEEHKDYYGGVVAQQDILVALVEGSDAAFAKARKLCESMFDPVRKSHQISLEQMALLEPGLVESITLTALKFIREALDYTVEEQGVPEVAARAFLLGHL